jgi:hypothetical protein
MMGVILPGGRDPELRDPESRTLAAAVGVAVALLVIVAASVLSLVAVAKAVWQMAGLWSGAGP